MAEPTDNTGTWIERLLEVVERERYDRLSGMTLEEEHALVLRLLGDRERASIAALRTKVRELANGTINLHTLVRALANHGDRPPKVALEAVAKAWDSVLKRAHAELEELDAS